MSRSISVVLLALLVCLGGCSKSRAPADEKKAFASLSFDTPLTVQVSLSQHVDSAGNLQATDDASLIALFAKAGFAMTAPSTTGAPWWKLVGVSSYYKDGTLVVPAATRVITDRKEQQYWTEGSVDYYAETITYELRLADNLKSLLKDVTLTGTLRLVLQKDPAVGHWEVYNDPTRGTKWSQTDSDALLQALVQVGARDTADFRNQIQATRKTSFDQIEKQIADSGAMQRVTGDQGLLYSKKNNLHYLVAERVRVGAITIGQLRGTCAQTHRSNLPWHLAHLSELQTIFGPSNFFSQSNIVDTPDHRLWPDFATITAPGLIVISDTPDANQPRAALAYKIEALGSQFVAQFQLTPLWMSGDFNTSPITDGYGGQFTLVAICVSNGKVEAPVAAAPPQRQASIAPPRRASTPPASNAAPDPDMDAAANLERAQQAVNRGDIAAALLPLRLAVQYGVGTPVGDQAAALATSLKDRLSPRDGVVDGCAIPLIPPGIDGMTANASQIAEARTRLTKYRWASKKFSICIHKTLIALQTQAEQKGQTLVPALYRKLLSPVDRNEQDLQTTMAAYNAAFAAYAARGGR